MIIWKNDSTHYIYRHFCFAYKLTAWIQVHARNFPSKNWKVKHIPLACLEWVRGWACLNAEAMAKSEYIVDQSVGSKLALLDRKGCFERASRMNKNKLWSPIHNNNEYYMKREDNEKNWQWAPWNHRHPSKKQHKTTERERKEKKEDIEPPKQTKTSSLPKWTRDRESNTDEKVNPWKKKWGFENTSTAERGEQNTTQNKRTQRRLSAAQEGRILRASDPRNRATRV